MPEIPYNWDTKLLGLLGWPLGHSIVPRVHNALYRYAGINAVLLPIELEDAPGKNESHPLPAAFSPPCPCPFA